jgi:predicted helicase
LGDGLSGKEKLELLKDSKLKNLVQEKISPDKNHNWINLSVSDFQTLLPLVKSDNENKKDEKLFNFATLGVSTNRDEWVFDFSKENLLNKITLFAEKYNELLRKQTKKDAKELQEAYEKIIAQGKKATKPKLVDEPDEWGEEIKWSETLKRNFMANKNIVIDENLMTIANYRPFTKQFYYANQLLSDRLTRNHYAMFGENLDKENLVIMIVNHPQYPDFQVHCTNILTDAGYSGRATPSIPFYTYLANGERVENITDWGLSVFRNRYSSAWGLRPFCE